MTERRVQIGTVTTVSPSKREVRVKVRRGRAKEFESLEWVRLRKRDGEEFRCRVIQARVTGDKGILKLGPGITRDSVAGMKGYAVELLASEMKHARGSAYDPDELVGLNAHAHDGERLGVIAAIIETKANAVIEIEKRNGGSILVPLIDEVIENVDLDKKVLVLKEMAPYAVDDDDTAPRIA